jgi:hypothetical protein
MKLTIESTIMDSVGRGVMSAFGMALGMGGGPTGSRTSSSSTIALHRPEALTRGLLVLNETRPGRRGEGTSSAADGDWSVSSAESLNELRVGSAIRPGLAALIVGGGGLSGVAERSRRVVKR